MEIKVEHGGIEPALKKFKKGCEGTLKEVRKRQYYRKPSVKKREKRANAIRFKLRYGI